MFIITELQSIIYNKIRFFGVFFLLFCFTVVFFCRQGWAILLYKVQRKHSSSNVSWYTSVQYWGLPALVLQPGRKIIPLIMESQTGLGWEGPYRSTSSNPSAMGSDTFHHSKLLRTLSSLELDTFRDVTSTLRGKCSQEAKIICTSTALGKKIQLRN